MSSARKPRARLSHVNARGAAHMVDVAAKTPTARRSIAAGEIRAAIPVSLNDNQRIRQSAGLTLSNAGVSGELRCLGSADAAFLLAPAGDVWVIVELAGAAGANTAPVAMWDRTRETIDHCFKGVSAEARERVLWKNAAELYRL